MAFPLYDAQYNDIEFSNNANKGLRFQRFFGPNDYSWEGMPESKAKTSFIDDLSGPAGSKVQLERYALRQLKLINHLKGKSKTFISDWHFVTGMGNNHPLENGMTWHHTLGTPYLPASSVKGLCRAFIENEIKDTFSQELIERYFGSAHGNDNQQAGILIFYDALPYDVVELVADIMTPHSGDWLTSGQTGKTAPADWHTPIPIPFLVCKKIKLLFSISKTPFSDISDKELDTVLVALTDALACYGAGAKTAVGYGFMDECNDDLAKMKKLLEKDLINTIDNEYNYIITRLKFLYQDMSKNGNNTAKKEINSQITDIKKAIKEGKQDWLAKQQNSYKNELVDILTAFGSNDSKRILKTLKLSGE